MSANTQIEKRLQELEDHLKNEDKTLLYSIIKIFRELDSVGYHLGILDEEQSYATSISWWPMISVLGTFSAGKSTFINSYLDIKNLQRTGNQAVDDKFTVITYRDKREIAMAGGKDSPATTFPGIALDADPRFPFYQISREIEEIGAGGSHRVDSFIQLKACTSPILKGKILIDSPGFDADSQRNATLRITRHIIDLSDLVLVFFDARHPEPGAMHDTLQHLVTETIDRPDANKFIFILNQIDITAREDNLEEVVAAWQRSLAQAGMTAGRFYRIYNPDVALDVEDATLKARMEAKNNADLQEIKDRMDQVGIERAYRIVGVLEHTAKDIENRIIPQLEELISRWKSRVFWNELFILIILLIGGGIWWTTSNLTLDTFPQDPTTLSWIGGGIIIVLLFIHLNISRLVANGIVKRLRYEIGSERERNSLVRAFRKNTHFLRTLFMPFVSQPCGWGTNTRRKLHKILGNVNEYVRRLNDDFTNPSGKYDEE